MATKLGILTTHDNQTWQGGDLFWGVSIVIITWAFKDVVLLTTWHTNNILSLLLQDLWPQNLERFYKEFEKHVFKHVPSQKNWSFTELIEHIYQRIKRNKLH